jgi:D-glycero-alpha-D-manno-heptose-7-phosphate kinase
MIIVRAPLRISYVGGGSDYPNFFEKNTGYVVGSTINKFVYVYANPLASIARERFRFSYRETESVQEISDLAHPVLREMLLLMGIDKPLNIGTFSDLPSGVGLGGSSAFAAALAKLLSLVKNQEMNRHEIAKVAIKVERDILKESGGYQDQYHASFGGFREYQFDNDQVKVSDPLLNQGQLDYINERQILIWTGLQRDSHGPALYTTEKSRTSEVAEVSRLAIACSKELSNSNSGSAAFEILTRYCAAGWTLKQRFSSPLIPEVERYAQIAMDYGAVSLKLCGAGGGGFLLILAEPDSIQKIQTHKSN